MATNDIVQPSEDEEVDTNLPDELTQAQPELAPAQASKWQWIGSANRPEAKRSRDGISDLFRVNSNPDTDDLISVDMERDILDADADGSLDSLTTVTKEDIMGRGRYGQPPSHRRAAKPRYRLVRQNYPSQAGGMR